MDDLSEIVRFHGHLCPGIAFGYRAAKTALGELGKRSEDEEIVAIVENDSCAVDSIQVLTGCTFGKGNLIFRDYGKQVYTFLKRGTGEAIRIAVDWKGIKETEKEKLLWKKFQSGDRSDRVMKGIEAIKKKKVDAILKAKEKDILKIKRIKMESPSEARIYPSIRCSICGEKVMEPRARVKGGKVVCIPCSEI